MTNIIEFEHPEEKPNIIKVIGVGGGGSNAVTHMFTEGICGVDFILCNTDSQALQRSPVVNKVHLGKRELGAGNVPDVGRQAAEETRDEIKEYLGENTKMLFITAGMGGGTGTGAAPVIASVAKELGILTVGIVTLPFSVEGKKREKQAVKGIEELRQYVDTLLVISNDKLREEYGDMKLTEAFRKADDILKIAAKGIAEIITVTGYINVDFEDVNTVMRNSGKAIMGSGLASGEDRAMNAVQEALNSPLLNDSDIKGAKNLLVYITSGSKEVTLDEVMTITEYVQDAAGLNSDMIWGNGEDATLGDSISVTIIATGFGDEKPVAIVEQPQADNRVVNITSNEMEVVTVKEKAVVDDSNTNKVVVHALGDNADKRKDTRGAVGFENVYDNVTSNVEYHTVMEKKVTSQDNMVAEMAGSYEEKEPVMVIKEEMSPEMDERKKRMSFLSDNSTFSDIDYTISQLEKQPAYKRAGINVSFKDVQSFSRNYYSQQNGGISSNNSYLHDNVD